MAENEKVAAEARAGIEPIYDHPAKFNVAFLPLFAGLLAHSEVVLDPMAGVGRIGRIKEYGWRGWVICNEIEPEWAEACRRAPGVDEVHVGDAANMDWAADGSIPAVCTSPTYGNRMADHHNARDGSKRFTYRHTLGRRLHPENTGQMHFGLAYRQKHLAIWAEIRRVMSNRGLLILNISDFMRAGKVVPVSDWHVQTLESLGFRLKAHYMVRTQRLRVGANRDLRVGYENVFVFEKH